VGVLLLILAFFIRVRPIWQRRYWGCDAYFFLLCTEEFRRRKRIPIVLPPYYLLEPQEQWYPPGFTVFLSVFPEKFVEKYYWAFSPAIDCLIVAVLYAVVYLATGSLWLAGLSGFSYAITPLTIAECISLNSRQLGSLLLAIVLLSLFGFINYSNFYLLGLFLLAGFLLLMTHKMSTQLLWFVLPIMSLVLWDATYFLGAVSIVIVAFLLSKGFYLKVLRGHYDILSFWNRNWRNLFAHQVHSSPVYGNENRDDTGRYFGKGFKDLYRLYRQLGSNFFVVMLIFPIIFYPQLSLFDKQMLWWVISTYFLAALTLFVPQFRFLGEGLKYLKMAAVPISYLTIVPIYYGWNIGYYFYPLLGITIVLSIWLTLRISRRVELSQTPALDSDFKQVIDFLNGKEAGAIVCIPCDLADTIAYHCRRSVLWGTHGYGFRKVEPFFPVLRKPLEFFISEYKLSYILIDSGYVSPELLRLSPADRIFVTDRYEIYQTEYGNK
jgi:hypothetical protein